MINVKTNLNVLIYILSIAFSIIVYAAVKGNFSWGAIQTVKLTQIYALTAASLLYLALLVEPLLTNFHSLPFRDKLAESRKSFGISAFYFALLHVYHAFFGQLGGFEGLKFLDNENLFIISLGFSALIILLLFTISAIKILNKALFKKSSFMNRLLYLTGLLIISHAVMMKVHFTNLASPLPLIFFFAIIFLLLLNTPMVDNFLERKFKIPQRLHITTIIILILAILLLSQYGPWTNEAVIDHSMDGFRMNPAPDK